VDVGCIFLVSQNWAKAIRFGKAGFQQGYAVPAICVYNGILPGKEFGALPGFQHYKKKGLDSCSSGFVVAYVEVNCFQFV